MATENFVLLTGILKDAPEHSILNDIKQMSFVLHTLRKPIPTKAGMDETDDINFFTRDELIISQMKKYKPGCILSVIGTFCSLDVEKEFQCNNKDCKEYQVPVVFKGCHSYINPIEVMPVDNNDGKELFDAKIKLYQYREHSNTARLTGRVDSPVKHITFDVTDRKNKSKELLHLWQFRVFVKRQKFVSNSLATSDYISINSYEPIEASKGDFVTVNGFVRAKQYTKERKCPCCGETIKTTDRSLSVIPYTLEVIKRMEV